MLQAYMLYINTPPILARTDKPLDTEAAVSAWLQPQWAC